MGNERSFAATGTRIGGSITTEFSSFNKCFSCFGSSISECQNNGQLVTCSNIDSCLIEVRTRGQNLVSIKSGCKEKNSCQDLKNQNFHSIVHFSQCKPENSGRQTRFGPSVCRQCSMPCDDSLANGAFCYKAASQMLPSWNYVDPSNGSTNPQTTMQYWNFLTENRAWWGSDLENIQKTNLLTSEQTEISNMG